MDLLFELLKQNLLAIPIAGLAGWLGKVWASRIARLEQSRIAHNLETIKSELRQGEERHKNELDTQKSLLMSAYERLASSESILIERQADAMKGFWPLCLQFRHEAGKFILPFQILTVSEIQDRTALTKAYPYQEAKTKASIDKVIELRKSMTELAPLVPEDFYILSKLMGTLYVRLGLKWMSHWHRKQTMVQWFSDGGSGVDWSVRHLLKYSDALNLNLPNPVEHSNPSQCLTDWLEILDRRQLKLAQNFFSGDLKNKAKSHKELFELLSVADPFPPQISSEMQK